MKLVSVNTAYPAPVEINGQSILTGINKQARSEPIWLGKLNLEGDAQADLTVHGGEFQAVYSYPIEHYAYWEKYLNKTGLPYGTFGENFTVSGLLETDVFVGDIYKVGQAVIQATMPRIPCFKFANKVDKPDIIEKFLFSGYSGFYHKVIEEGEVVAEDAIHLIERDPQSISIRQALGLYKLKEGNKDTLTHALRIKSLPPLLRDNFESRLEKLSI